MDLGLKGRIALVTGASRGIGAAIARVLAGEGMSLMLVARSTDGLEETAAAVRAAGSEAATHPADLRRPEAAGAAVADAIARFGRLDLLVNCAGATKRGDFLALTDEDWADGYALKLHGAVRMCRAAWPHLVASHGAVVNIAGAGGRVASADFTIGGSVNAALMNFTKALADRGVKDGVRVNCINPGLIATDRLAARVRARAAELGADEAAGAASLAEEHGIGRIGAPEEIGRVVAFLASEHAAGYVQGALWDVDGGWVRAV
ncbi:MAG: SDR family oxidoreductase [Acetobacteraceae bacterium]|nr:SDR family oxidoreductase [Acetobacteraceae bacterium]